MITNDFWLDRWKAGKIGFHQEGISSQLIEFWPTLPHNSRILVPLCGKSNDMIWLAEQGYQVTGVELSPLAVVQFLGDNELSYDTHQEGDLKIHTVKNLPLRIVEGDFFTFTENQFDACYDRAAMVAIPHSQRQHYVTHLFERLLPNPWILFISVLHDGDGSTPPFSINEQDIISLWGDNMKKIATEDLVQTTPRYKERGYALFEESVWRTQP